MEAVTWSFVSKPQAELFGGGKGALALANPIAAEMSDMRPSLVPGLVAAAQKNADRGYGNVALFEVGQIFRDDRPEDQLIAASGVRRGLAKASGWSRHWATGSKPADAFDVVVPSLPGFGFSSKPKGKPAGPPTTARLWNKLMTEVLGYPKYVAQGGDWGFAVTAQLAHEYPDKLFGIHLNGAGGAAASPCAGT